MRHFKLSIACGLLAHIATHNLLAQPKPPTFVVNDQVVSSPKVSLSDPEFDQIGYQMTWQDSQNRLWVIPVNPQTGSFTPKTGYGTQLDSTLSAVSQTNGPEWVYSSQGQQIVYTKFINGLQVLGRAKKISGNWQAESLPASTIGAASPIGSKNPADPNPTILYYPGNVFPTPRNPVYWRYLNNAASEGIVPDPTADRGRWVEGEPSIITSILVNGYYQTAKYVSATNTVTQLTFDTSNTLSV